MAFEITTGTSINELLSTYPELEDFLVSHHPAFKSLKNAFMRKTVGRIATIGKAAGIAGIDPDELVRVIRERIASGIQEVALPTPEERREALKELLRDLHQGTPQEEIQDRFNEFASGLSANDIAAIEKELVAEGIPASEIKGLCDFHARLMGSAVEAAELELPPGHPCHTLKLENVALEAQAVRLEQLVAGIEGTEVPASCLGDLTEILAALGTFDIHYQRKEYQFFPYLEKHDITAPPPVMWAVHDDIRASFKRIRAAVADGDLVALRQGTAEFVHNFREMVFKEERILVPMCMEAFTTAEWHEIRKGESDIGFALVEPVDWRPAEGDLAVPAGALPTSGLKQIALDTGMLSAPQINMLLRSLPLDVTFVDENDEVRYFSDTPERIFPRSPGIIGRKVQNCHPPKSVDTVIDILEAFRAGREDSAEFWIQVGGQFLHIRYFAMRDPLGKYRGCLEVSQDVTDIRALQDERRLLEWGSK